MTTLKDIARLRLLSQQIEGAHFKSAKAIVNHMGAMQAQDYAMAKWAIGMRLPGATNKTIKAALNKGDILRTHVMRPTWHLVSADDIYWLLELSKPQISTVLRARHKALELNDKIISRTNSIIEKLLRDGEHLTREVLMAAIEKAKIPTKDNNRSSHIMLHAELEGIVASGKMEGNKHTYALLSDRVKKPKAMTRDEALAKLAEKYFTSHGPATLKDFTWWSGLPIKDAKKALENVKEKFVSEETGAETYWLKASLHLPKTHKTTVHLLPAFDEYLISYKDRTASIIKEHQKHAFSSNGIFWPVVLVDGHAKGLWKRTVKKDKVLIETNLFHKQDKTILQLIEKAAKQFGDFLGREVEIQAI